MSIPHPADLVVIELPAKGPCVALLRSAAVSLAAALDYPIDEIDEIKIVTGEAVSLMVDAAPDDATLRAEFSLTPTSFTASLSTPGVTELDRDSFAWTILEALADDLSTSASSEFTLSFAKRSSSAAEKA